MKPFNELTPAEAERLALLAEDAGNDPCRKRGQTQRWCNQGCHNKELDSIERSLRNANRIEAADAITALRVRVAALETLADARREALEEIADKLESRRGWVMKDALGMIRHFARTGEEIDGKAGGT